MLLLNFDVQHFVTLLVFLVLVDQSSDFSGQPCVIFFKTRKQQAHLL